jgi:hypothetical protein
MSKGIVCISYMNHSLGPTKGNGFAGEGVFSFQFCNEEENVSSQSNIYIKCLTIGTVHSPHTHVRLRSYEINLLQGDIIL